VISNEHPVTSELRRRLTASLAPELLELADQSHLHAGHAGAQGGGRHYSVTIRSDRFRGLSTVAQHRLVYDSVKDLMPHPVHALALQTGLPP
jgi:BolA family transcriptional regulator, general stress-responsive regulator